ncbi:MAG: DUF2141 domain-containing protein [Desulfuromonadales bacterium]|nr:DUF2141 domain-containing protein [Desulfuromonadales bacterium]
MGRIDVQLVGFRSRDGEVIVSLFASAEGFPDRIQHAVATRNLPIRDLQAATRFDGLAYGRYAISVLHDENGDGLMNSSWLGTPREGFGFSGHPEYRFGQPTFAEAAFFLVTPQRDVVIGLRYATGRQERQRDNQQQRQRGTSN